MESTSDAIERLLLVLDLDEAGLANAAIARALAAKLDEARDSESGPRRWLSRGSRRSCVPSSTISATPPAIDSRSSLTCSPRWATPRVPARRTLGGAATKIARELGQPLMPWQQQVFDVALELDERTGRLVYREVMS
jgi:hypothetical protein